MAGPRPATLVTWTDAAVSSSVLTTIAVLPVHKLKTYSHGVLTVEEVDPPARRADRRRSARYPRCFHLFDQLIHPVRSKGYVVNAGAMLFQMSREPAFLCIDRADELEEI